MIFSKPAASISSKAAAIVESTSSTAMTEPSVVPTAAAPTAAAKCPFDPGDATARFPLPRQRPMDPPDDYARLGETQPVRRVMQWNGAPAWFITGYANVRAMLADPRTTATDWASQPMSHSQIPRSVMFCGCVGFFSSVSTSGGCLVLRLAFRPLLSTSFL